MESRGVLRSPGGNPPARGTPPPQNDVASGAQPVALMKELNVLRLSVRDKDFQLMNVRLCFQWCGKGGLIRTIYSGVTLRTHNSSLEGAMKLKFVPFCSS